MTSDVPRHARQEQERAADEITEVDPGLPGTESWRQLLRRLNSAHIPLDRVHTVVVTHSHFDHFGGALRLRDEVKACVVTHQSFRLSWDTAELFDDEDSGSLELNDDDAIAAFRERHPTSTPWGTAIPVRPSKSSV